MDAMVDVPYLITKILHVLFATLWAGGGLTNLVVTMPTLQNATMGTRTEAMGRLMPNLFRYNNAVGGLTLLSGILLVTLHPYGWDGITTTAWGKLILFALIVTVAVLYLSGTSVRSTMKAMRQAAATIKPGDDPPPGLRFLQARLRLTIFLANGLVLLVLFVMVYANVIFAGPA